jgi:3-methyladenine DNA glycosylase/8-oxoguanine DNA glycosylase
VTHGYTLLGPDGRPYDSSTAGTLGGHRRTRIYGRLDCPSALRAVARGGYTANRVFFADEATARAAGFRPCAICLPEAHTAWRGVQAVTRWRIEARGSLEPTLVIRMLAAHGIPGVERTEPTEHRHTRLLRTSAGPRPVTVTADEEGVDIEGPFQDAGTRGEIGRRVRQWFDLDAELAPVRAVLAGDPLLAPLVAARPGLRVLGYPEPFEAAIVTVLGQQVSVAAARTFAGRLAAGYGTPGPDGLTLFPSPATLAAIPVDDLQSVVGVTTSRAATIRAVALTFAAHPEQLSRAELLAIPGVGPWSADYLAVRSSTDRDSFTAGDLVLRRALGQVDARSALARAEAWRPYRAYALFHLWVAAAYLS